MTHVREDKGIRDLYQAVRLMGGDGFREMLRVTLQGLMEEELTALLGAEVYEQTEGRGGYVLVQREMDFLVTKISC